MLLITDAQSLRSSMKIANTYALENSLETIKEWQTLISAGLALLAALGTILVMYCQSLDEKKRHKEERKKKEFASRTQMSDALSEMCGYSRNICGYLLDSDTELPSVPSGALAVLKQVIEHIDVLAAQRVFELVTHYQVQRSRIAGRTSPLQEFQRLEYLYDAILLHAYTDSLFNYARNEDEVGPALQPTFSELRSAFRVAVGPEVAVRDEQRFGPLLDLLDRRQKDLG